MTTNDSKDQGREAQLLPCPFCGCSVGADDLTSHEVKRHTIKCPDCPCRMEYFSSTKEEAVFAWNRRLATNAAALARDEASVELTDDRII